MNFHCYQIQLLENKRKELIAQANSQQSSEENLLTIRKINTISNLENQLKTLNLDLQEKIKELEKNLKEKQLLSTILTELDNLKTISNDKDDVIKLQQDTWAKLSQLLPIEEKLKEAINNNELEIKTLEDQAQEFFEANQKTETINEVDKNIVWEKIAQIIKKSDDKTTDNETV